jgi:hypothetical protein
VKRILSFITLAVSVLISFGCNSDASYEDSEDGLSECKEGAFNNCRCEGQPPRDGMQFCEHAGGGVWNWSSCECPNACDQMTNSCGTCAECAEGAVCKSQLTKCNNSQACVSMSDCFFSECDDSSCFFECAKKNPTGAKDYIDYAACVECNACSQNCSGSGLCDQSCTTKCLLTFPAGVVDFDAMYACRVCGVCSLSCADGCTGTTGSGACSTSGDCNTCINGDCAVAACSTETETCGNNPDCVSLSNCLSSCP